MLPIPPLTGHLFEFEGKVRRLHNSHPSALTGGVLSEEFVSWDTGNAQVRVQILVFENFLHQSL
jgi:hypothetical protein